MSFIKTIVPMKGYRLFMDMESGSNVIVDFSCKLHTLKYGELKDEALFNNVKTDGNYVVWGEGRVKATAGELMDVVLIGEYTGQL